MFVDIFGDHHGVMMQLLHELINWFWWQGLNSVCSIVLAETHLHVYDDTPHDKNVGFSLAAPVRNNR